DLARAKSASATSGKPIFLLFQEVPGCAGCKEFGRTVLSHALLKEAVESAFEPVVVFNNQAGADKAVLEAFREPAWNYQVVRFLDAAGKDLIPRKDRIWTVDGVAGRMIAALQAAGRPVPNYLRAVQANAAVGTQKEVAFAMACFWTGEARIGGIPGVIATEAGWLDNREVTRVRFDAKRLSIEALATAAKAADCAKKSYSAKQIAAGYRPAQASDQKRQLTGVNLSGVKNLTPMQLTKLNALYRVDREAALTWLSPTQVQTLEQGANSTR
ncbi:MAG: hypothetical protein ACI8W8_003278, partial [Rhodothermales bacterium]